jgi:hypothetical protein
MQENSFQFEGTFYEQTFGTSMGNALSPFDANLFMGGLRAYTEEAEAFSEIMGTVRR